MKIGIITYHFARNYGAVLQCYALQKHLLAMGHQVEVLNYVTEFQSRCHSLHHKREDPLRNMFLNLVLLAFERGRRRKEQRFVSFTNDNLALSRRLGTLEELRSYVLGNGIELLISGSDQVFNPSLADFDRAFLFPFETNAVKASFAASVGGSSHDVLLPYSRDLSAFDYLSVREGSSAYAIEGLCGSLPEIVEDPVFLLNQADWIGLRSNIWHPDGFVLGYFVNKAELPRCIEVTSAIAKRLNKPWYIINVRFGAYSFRKNVLVDIGPSEFLGLFSGASFICTDSFHGTAFSLILDKPFISFELPSRPNDKRKLDLLEGAGMLNRSVCLDESISIRCIVQAADFSSPGAQGYIASIRTVQERYLKTITGVNPKHNKSSLDDGMRQGNVE